MEERNIAVTPDHEKKVIQWCLAGHGYTRLSRQVLITRGQHSGMICLQEQSCLPQNAVGTILNHPVYPGVYVFSFSLRPGGNVEWESDDVETLMYWRERAIGAG